MNNTIPQWQQLVYALAKSKGWYDDVDLDAHKLMAEFARQESVYLSEITEKIRNGEHVAKTHTFERASTRDPQQSIKLARLWLVASEVFEAIECIVNGQEALSGYVIQVSSGKPEGLGIELADVAIRLLDFCEAYQIPLDRYMTIKHTYNESRPQRHGGKKV